MTKRTAWTIIVFLSWLSVCLWLAVMSRDEALEKQRVDFTGFKFVGDAKIRPVVDN